MRRAPAQRVERKRRRVAQRRLCWWQRGLQRRQALARRLLEHVESTGAGRLARAHHQLQATASAAGKVHGTARAAASRAEVNGQATLICTSFMLRCRWGRHVLCRCACACACARVLLRKEEPTAGRG